MAHCAQALHGLVSPSSVSTLTFLGDMKAADQLRRQRTLRRVAERAWVEQKRQPGQSKSIRKVRI